MKNRATMEITSTRNGCYEQDGIVGRVESWPTALIMQVMETDNLGDVSPWDIVPGTDVSLYDYLHYHHVDECHVVRKGQPIA